MSLKQLTLPAGLLAAVVVASPLGAHAVGPTKARDRKPPRIVAAAMLDANRNFRADRVRLTYSEPVRHAADRDGRYPFAVAGYRVRSVGAPAGRTLTLVLAEKAQPDPAARPAIRYRRTFSKPVRDRAGNQAVAQLFRLVRAHRHTPAATPISAPAPAPAPPPPAAAADADRDGTPDARDCAPKDAAIHPGAPDLPDLSFVDSNCDGIDGTVADAIFVSPTGNDNNPGTKAKPKRTIQAAVATVAAGNGKYVLVAAGEHGRLELDKKDSGLGVYGGYDPKKWLRSTGAKTFVEGRPEAVLADGSTGIVLQLLTIAGGSFDSFSSSAYGIRASDGSKLTFQRVTVDAGAGYTGSDGGDGIAGANGGAGGDGNPGACDDTDDDARGGAGGVSPAGRDGGKGGFGGVPFIGDGGGGYGGGGRIGTAGGVGGPVGDPGRPGHQGVRGADGGPGATGSGGARRPSSRGTSGSAGPGSAGLRASPGTAAVAAAAGAVKRRRSVRSTTAQATAAVEAAAGQPGAALAPAADRRRIVRHLSLQLVNRRRVEHRHGR